MANKKLYFAFGGNMLTSRMRRIVPTAVRKYPAKLEDHELDFGYYTSNWNGCVPTIVPKKGSYVWGAVWEVDENDVALLNKQGATELDIYRIVEVTVIPWLSSNSDTQQGVRCFTFQLSPHKQSKGLPSLTYLKMMWDGAIESDLPETYIEQLKKIKHNNYEMLRSKVKKQMMA